MGTFSYSGNLFRGMGGDITLDDYAHMGTEKDFQDILDSLDKSVIGKVFTPEPSPWESACKQLSETLK